MIKKTNKKALQEQSCLKSIAYVYAVSAHAIDKKVSAEKALALICRRLREYVA